MHKWIDRFVQRWAPGYWPLMLVVLVGCGGAERTACYAQADVWLHEQARLCHNRGYAWEACPERPELLEEHKQKESACP